MRIAIVVPTLNEESTLARTLPAALAALAAVSEPAAPTEPAAPATPEISGELIVSDGGSSDRTIEVARALGARVVTGPAGRGGQLNRGAAATSAEILLFLHADTTLPPGALAAVHAAVAAGPAIGGAFLVRFDDDRLLLRLGAWLINQRTRATRLPLGDQAHFVRRSAFEELGGYRDWPILEDLDFAWRLRRHGPTVILRRRVTTGARRFVELGVARTVATNWLIWLLFVVGVPPRRLARLYDQVR